MNNEPAPRAGQARRKADTAGDMTFAFQADTLFADAEPGDEPALDSSGVTRARLRYEEEQAHYNELYLLAPVGYFVLAFDSTILQMNLAGADLLGIARARPGGIRFRSFISPACLRDFDAFISRALNSDQPRRCRVAMQHGAREAFHVTLLASADCSGQACRVVVERAETRLAALEQSEERLRRIVHDAEEGVWEIDAMSRTSFVNPRMAAMLGYEIEDMLGQPLACFIDEEGKDMLERHIARRRAGIVERHEFKFQHRHGHAVWAMMATNPILDAAGRYVGALALVSDMGAGRQAAPLAWQQASVDPLTRLPNRRMFMERLRNDTRRADRDGAFLALLHIDLDHFKTLNERFGKARGDVVLREAARRIASCVRSTDTLARFDGDDFTVILAGIEHAGSAERIARAVVAALALPFDMAGDKALLTASVGVALYPPDADDVDTLLECAGHALHGARSAGRNGFSLYTPQLQQAARARRSMAADLRAAIAAGQFEILYQPIVSLRTGAVRKAEALLRWRHPTRGVLGPAEFIPFAESSGLISGIGDWVFREAASQAQRWQRCIDPSFQVSVNKSPVQFRRDAALYGDWVAHLQLLGLPPNSIAIEIPESVLMDGVEQVVERLRKYRAMGMQVSLDDFGTGYASLSHLKRFDIDFVKIDRSFVATLEREDGDLALCEAIIAMAHKLGLKVVAEGVESEAQRALLADAGCDYAQGFAIARPMPAGELEALAGAG